MSNAQALDQIIARDEGHWWLRQLRSTFNLFPTGISVAVRREWLHRRHRKIKSYPNATREERMRRGLDDNRFREATIWLQGLAASLPDKALNLGASESDLIDYAVERAKEGDQLWLKCAEDKEINAYCLSHGVPVPDGETTETRARRVGCEHWWRRNLRRVNARKAEAIAISLGLVHRQAGLYASDDAVARRTEQRRRNRVLLDALTAINELGQSFSLSDLADKSVSNRAIRRAELMTRIAGFEYIAVGLGLAGEFITITAPSRYHARRQSSGQRNPKYAGFTPRDTSQYLCQVWSRITAALARAEVCIFGFRVAEPHHDGTPHYHGLFFMKPEDVPFFRRTVARHVVREDRDELGLHYALSYSEAMAQARQLRTQGKTGSLSSLAETIGHEVAFWEKPPQFVWKQISARFKAIAIDWKRGTAAGYIAKYIAKNIDGVKQDGSHIGDDFEALGTSQDRPSADTDPDHETSPQTDARQTALRVDAWAATWGIRQFQQVGGPPVGIWRELRRWDYAGADDVLLQAAAAADAGNWGRFVEVMGGYERRRRDMPLALSKDETPTMNRYGESAQPTVCGVLDKASGELAISRMHQWTIKPGGFAGRQPAWTCVNNSTFLKSPEKLNDIKQPTAEQLARWQAAEEEDTLRRITSPDDIPITPEWRASRQQLALQEKALQAYKDLHGPEGFASLIDSWIHDASNSAEQRARCDRLRQKGAALYQRMQSVNTGRGLGVLAGIKAQHHQAERYAHIEPPARRWVHTNQLPLNEQLNQLTRSANHWLTEVQRSMEWMT